MGIRSSGSVEPIRYKTEERTPVAMKCDYHGWEGGYVLLRDSPYMAKTDDDGEFEIANLPYGTHTFRLWHERVGYLKNVSIGKYKTTDRGELIVQIGKAATQLGTARLPLESLTRPPSKTKASATR